MCRDLLLQGRGRRFESVNAHYQKTRSAASGALRSQVDHVARARRGRGRERIEAVEAVRHVGAEALHQDHARHLRASHAGD